MNKLSAITITLFALTAGTFLTGCDMFGGSASEEEIDAKRPAPLPAEFEKIALVVLDGTDHFEDDAEIARIQSQVIMEVQRLGYQPVEAAEALANVGFRALTDPNQGELAAAAEDMGVVGVLLVGIARAEVTETASVYNGSATLLGQIIDTRNGTFAWDGTANGKAWRVDDEDDRMPAVMDAVTDMGNSMPRVDSSDA